MKFKLSRSYITWLILLGSLRGSRLQAVSACLCFFCRPMSRFTAQCESQVSSAVKRLSTDFIPESVYDSLVSAVNKHLPLLQRYILCEQRFEPFLTWRCMICTHLWPGQTTSSLMKEALAKSEEVLFWVVIWASEDPTFSERWIDVHENQGKRSGASQAVLMIPMLCCSTGRTLDNLFTLVHETSHSMHSSYTRETQPYVYGTTLSS